MLRRRCTTEVTVMLTTAGDALETARVIAFERLAVMSSFC